MNWTPKVLATLAVAAAVVVLGLWISRKDKPSSDPIPPAPITNSAPQPSWTNKPGPRPSRPPSTAVNTNLPPALPDVSGTNQITNWETTLAELLNDETSEPNAKGRKLLEIFPRIPADGQAETAQHIANLLADEDYALLATYFTNITTSVEVQEVILADLLGRPNSVKLPVLLDAARTPEHPKAADAKEMLELYLEHNYGADWDAWRKRMEEWLQANPD